MSAAYYETCSQTTDLDINATPIRFFPWDRAANWQDTDRAQQPGYLYGKRPFPNFVWTAQWLCVWYADSCAIIEGLPILVKDLTAVKGQLFTQVT